MGQLYDEDFYDLQRVRSRTSAQVMVPIFQELLEPESVLDVGCGIGAWSATWIAAGVSDLTGVDGDYVDRSALVIPPAQFRSWDLTRPLDLGRRFDLVQCLEVAEHLPANSAKTLVESLVRHSDLVVFSAAVPRQGGTHHVNEQWPSYWVSLFASVGFQVFDPFRARVWDDNRVEYWYRQNCILFAAKDHPITQRLDPPSGPIDVVHPYLFESWASAAAGVVKLRWAVSQTRLGTTLRSIRNRFGA